VKGKKGGSRRRSSSIFSSIWGEGRKKGILTEKRKKGTGVLKEKA